MFMYVYACNCVHLIEGILHSHLAGRSMGAFFFHEDLFHLVTIVGAAGDELVAAGPAAVAFYPRLCPFVGRHGRIANPMTYAIYSVQCGKKET